MNIVVFGGNGTIGRRIVLEALRRGAEVTAVSRSIDAQDVPGVITMRADVTDKDVVEEIAEGRDVVISAIGPAGDEDPSIIVRAAESLVDGMHSNPLARLVVVGGAGSLEVSDGRRLMDTEAFPEDWKPTAEAHFAALEVYLKADDVMWTYFSPAAMTEPRERTGIYRRGTDHLLMDGEGKSYISAEDLAVAILDELELEEPTFGRITVGY